MNNPLLNPMQHRTRDILVPHRSTLYNVNLGDEPEQSNDTGGGGGGGGGDEPFGLVCDYEPGKLDKPPK
ncbi:hypothetical protein BGZ47_010120, partial [Haplosporangium gracile]